MTMNIETTIYITDSDGGEVEIPVRLYFTASYTPAYVSGPPDNCYPEDTEFEWTKVETLNDLPPGITDAMVQAECERDNERLEELAWEEYFNSADYGPEDDDPRGDEE